MWSYFAQQDFTDDGMKCSEGGTMQFEAFKLMVLSFSHRLNEYQHIMLLIDLILLLWSFHPRFAGDYNFRQAAEGWLKLKQVCCISVWLLLPQLLFSVFPVQTNYNPLTWSPSPFPLRNCATKRKLLCGFLFICLYHSDCCSVLLIITRHGSV